MIQVLIRDPQRHPVYYHGFQRGCAWNYFGIALKFRFSMILWLCLVRFGNSSPIWKSMGLSIAEAKDRIETSSIPEA